MEGETQYALNPGKTKEWFSVTENHFQTWAEISGILWRAIKPHIDDTMEKACSLWPEVLKDLPMNEEHKDKLKEHWGKLQSDFKIEATQ